MTEVVTKPSNRCRCEHRATADRTQPLADNYPGGHHAARLVRQPQGVMGAGVS
jgi:hypothetical protein